MEIAINRAFPLLRTHAQPSQPSPPDIAVIVSQRALYNALGQTHVSDIPPRWFETTRYARALADRNAILISTPLAADKLDGIQSFVLSSTLASAEPGLEEFIRARLAAGDNVLATSDTLAREWNIPTEPWAQGLAQLPDGAGTFYVIDFQE